MSMTTVDVKIQNRMNYYRTSAMYVLFCDPSNATNVMWTVVVVGPGGAGIREPGRKIEEDQRRLKR